MYIVLYSISPPALLSSQPCKVRQRESEWFKVTYSCFSSLLPTAECYGSGLLGVQQAYKTFNRLGAGRCTKHETRRAKEIHTLREMLCNGQFSFKRTDMYIWAMRRLFSLLKMQATQHLGSILPIRILTFNLKLVPAAAQSQIRSGAYKRTSIQPESHPYIYNSLSPVTCPHPIRPPPPLIPIIPSGSLSNSTSYIGRENTNTTLWVTFPLLWWWRNHQGNRPAPPLPASPNRHHLLLSE